MLWNDRNKYGYTQSLDVVQQLARLRQYLQILMLIRNKYKVHPITGHEGPDGE
jgi:hypothetical protein